ncbi:hypothetical protein DSECCO2_612720 [anaerobic digester metagenome]
MVAEARLKIAVVARDHEKVAVGQGGGGGGFQVRVHGGFHHDGQEPARVSGRRPGPGHGGHAVPQGQHGRGGDVGQIHHGAGHRLAEPAVDVQQPVLQLGAVDPQLLAQTLGAGAGGAHVIGHAKQHLHGLLVAEAGDVVQGAAMGGGELWRLRVQQVQGQHQPRGFGQRGVHGATLHKVAARGVAQNIFDAAGVHAAVVRVHGDDARMLQKFGGAGQPEQGGHAVLAGHAGQVPGGTARLGHHGGSA